MAVIGRSAKGEIVDFDILKIKQQLASRPAAVSVDGRRKFIDTKDGVKPKEQKQQVQNALRILTTEEEPVITQPDLTDAIDVNDLLAVALEAATQSSTVKTTKK